AGPFSKSEEKTCLGDGCRPTGNGDGAGARSKTEIRLHHNIHRAVAGIGGRIDDRDPTGIVTSLPDAACTLCDDLDDAQATLEIDALGCRSERVAAGDAQSVNCRA